MTDELVEKLARAIVETYYAHTENATEADRVVCPTDLNAAQAALAAIRETHAIVPREPTEAMAEAGFETLICNKDPWMPAAKNTYQAMIEAAPREAK